ncbi:hypothetical protein CPB84DRAFT_275056 [Gymnopilus junonius]|uniref:Uncharacterized protein n=1 Tax=Gymnopilus junonius TaxID=109634 RepID=A0A9P5NT40_GYMJU|nr:hypothetical protein CPB84DRAFT_275056 [Gymnopilus junonius]
METTNSNGIIAIDISGQGICRVRLSEIKLNVLGFRKNILDHPMSFLTREHLCPIPYRGVNLRQKSGTHISNDSSSRRSYSGRLGLNRSRRRIQITDFHEADTYKDDGHSIERPKIEWTQVKPSNPHSQLPFRFYMRVLRTVYQLTFHFPFSLKGSIGAIAFLITPTSTYHCPPQMVIFHMDTKSYSCKYSRSILE